MNSFRDFVRMILACLMILCVVGLGVLGYIHLGPFIHSQRQYSGGKLVGVVSGERFDGHWALIGYRFASDKFQEEVWFPAYGPGWTKFYTYLTPEGTMQFFASEGPFGDGFYTSMAAKGKALELDRATQEKAMQLLQIGRKRFAAVGGVLPAQIASH